MATAIASAVAMAMTGRDQGQEDVNPFGVNAGLPISSNYYKITFCMIFFVIEGIRRGEGFVFCLKKGIFPFYQLFFKKKKNVPPPLEN